MNEIRSFSLGQECTHGQLARQCELCDKDSEIERLTGEAALMRSLLRECDAVLSIVEAENDDEAQYLARLRQHIRMATGGENGALL